MKSRHYPKGHKSDSRHYPDYLKALIISMIAATLPTFLTWLNLTFQYIYHYKPIKLFMYSITFMIPSIIEIMLGLLKIRFTEAAFFVLVYAINFLIYYLIINGYIRSRKKGRYAKNAFLGVWLYCIISMMYLW